MSRGLCRRWFKLCIVYIASLYCRRCLYPSTVTANDFGKKQQSSATQRGRLLVKMRKQRATHPPDVLAVSSYGHVPGSTQTNSTADGQKSGSFRRTSRRKILV